MRQSFLLHTCKYMCERSSAGESGRGLKMAPPSHVSRESSECGKETQTETKFYLTGMEISTK